MCGIAGYADFNHKTDPSVIKKMTDSIFYRGPDSSGRYINGRKTVGIGIRRLSIIDLKTGDQPIKNEDGSVVVVYNGEIYNYKDLKNDLESKGHRFKTKTDTEVLVHGYEEYKEDFAKYLNGMYAFALWDEKNQKLVLGRDRAGIKPLYYFNSGSTLLFGSEPKVILKHPLYRMSINDKALSYYFYLGFLPGDLSMFTGIKKLKPGNTLTFTRNKLALKKFFDLSLLLENRKIIDNPYGELDALMDRVVQSQLIADVPVGVFLSGGLDSSLISYYISKHKKLKSFSIGFEESGFDESSYAHQVAKMLGTDHHSEEFGFKDVPELFGEITSKLDEPLADASLIPTFKVSRLARRYVKVALSGDGGDELFGGYPTYQANIINKYFKRFPANFFDQLGRTVDLVPDKIFDLVPLSFKDYPKKKLLKIVLNGLKLKNPERHLYFMRTFFLGNNLLDKKPEFSAIEEITGKEGKLPPVLESQLIDFNTYLRDDFLVKSDRASMYNSLEVRVPYLDNETINFAFSLKFDHATFFKTKILMRKLLEKKLPEVAKRPKKGFGIPLERWLRGPIKDFAYSYLQNDKLYKYIEKKKINNLWTDHQSEKDNNAGLIWLLVVFSGWLKNYA